MSSNLKLWIFTGLIWKFFYLEQWDSLLPQFFNQPFKGNLFLLPTFHIF